MCVVSLDAECQCLLCGHLFAVQETVSTSSISAATEGQALVHLMDVYGLLRRPLGPGEPPLRMREYAAARGATDDGHVSAPRAAAMLCAPRCIVCGRCVCRARMSLVSPDAEDQCEVCFRLCAVRNAVPISHISAADEERAWALLAEVLALLQGEWEPDDCPLCAVQCAAAQGSAFAGSPPGRGPLPWLTRRWRRGVLSDAPLDVP